MGRVREHYDVGWRSCRARDDLRQRHARSGLVAVAGAMLTPQVRELHHVADDADGGHDMDHPA